VFLVFVFTGSFASIAKRWYLSYSEAHFEVFHPTDATRCTDGVKFDTADGIEGPLLRVKFHPHGCNDKGIEPPKLKFLLRLDQNRNINPAGSYPLCDFHIICEFCTPFQDALAVKISLIC